MKKNSTSIKACLSLAGLLMFSSVVQAQVIYNPFDPDVTPVAGVPYEADLNGDLIPDFFITANNGPLVVNEGQFNGDAVAVVPASGNSVLIDQGSLYRFATSVPLGSSVGGASTEWSDEIGVLAANGTVTITTPITFTTPVQGGNFVDKTDQYVAVQFTAGGNVHYGWIRVDVSGYNSITIKDWAYESTPNTPITVGQIPTGISEYILKNTKMIVSENFITAEFSDAFEGKMEMINLSGQTVKTANVNGNSCSLNTSDLTAGIYQVIVSGREGYAAKKVVVY